MRVEDVMPPGLAVVDRDTPASQARRLMRLRGVSALPVVDEYGAPVGIVTATDFVERHPGDTSVSEIMTPALVTIRRQADVAAAAKLMLQHEIHHVVVTQAGRAIGIVSSFDLLRLVAGRKRPAKKK